MKIAIISDSHDNIPNLKKVLTILDEEKIDHILHCGDVSSPDTLNEIFLQFQGKINLAFGNTDFDHFEEKKNYSEEMPNLEIWKYFGVVEIGGKKIAFLHFPDKARELAESQKYDFVFYGHSHKPWEEKIGKTEFVNPGNVAGLYYRASFAILDLESGKLSLKILDQNPQAEYFSDTQ